MSDNYESNIGMTSIQDWDTFEVTEWVENLNEISNKFVRCLGRYEINGSQLCALTTQQIEWLYHFNYKTPAYYKEQLATLCFFRFFIFYFFVFLYFFLFDCEFAQSNM